MPRKPKPTQGELIPDDAAPRWTVSSSEPNDQGVQIHRLFYGKQRQQSGKTPADLARFNAIAEHNNRRGLAPRPKVLCRADENLPTPKHHAAAKP